MPRSEGQRRRTEWVILRARYAAAGIGVIVTLTVLDTPRQQLWIAALILGATAVLTHLALLRRPTGRWLTAVGIGSFALDALAVVTTLAVVREDPADPVTLVALLLAIEAGMRWQVIGGLLGGLGAGLAAGIWTQVAHLQATGVSAPVEYVAFRTAGTWLVAVMVGSMVRAVEVSRYQAQTVLALSPELILTLDADGRIAAANPAVLPVLGLKPNAVTGRAWRDLLAPGEDPALSPAPGTGLITRALCHADGHEVWLECSVRHEPRAGLATVIARDITARRASERARSASEQRFRALFDRNLDAVFGLDLEGRITDVNPASAALLGQTSDELIGTAAAGLISEESLADAEAALATAMGGKAADVEVVLAVADSSQRHVMLTLLPIVIDGVTSGVFGLAEDITDRTRREAELAYRAGHDALTGLANRASLLAHLTERLEDRHATAVLFIDLDGFKNVNDTYGHAAGDAVLVATAHRLRAVVRGGDLVARLAGDEFCVVLHPADEHSAHLIAARATHAAAEPVRLAGTAVGVGASVKVGASVGVALARDHETAEVLLARADREMYVAKTLRRKRPPRPGVVVDRRQR